MAFFRNLLDHKHAVTVAVKAVALSNCVRVGAECEVAACQGAHQHEQCGLRKVKVGEQPPNHAKFESGIYKQARFSSPRLDSSAALVPHMFEGADAGGAYANDAPALLERPIQSDCGGLGNLIPFGFHLMFFHSVHPHRLKCPQAHVECDLASFNPALTQRLENSFREVKACRGGSYCATDFGVDRLVGLAILRFVGARM